MKMNCQLESNCKPKRARNRLAASASLSALIGMLAFGVQPLRADVNPPNGGCNSVGCSVEFTKNGVNIGSSGVVEPGDQIKVLVTINTAVALCQNGINVPFCFEHGTLSITFPGVGGGPGAVELVTANLPIVCPGAPRSFTSVTTYTVNPAHIRPATGGRIFFTMNYGNVNSIPDAGDGSFHSRADEELGAESSCTASLTVRRPCIDVVKECDFPAGQNCFPFGAPIKFKGFVTNCSPDETLTSVTASDNHAGPLVLTADAAGTIPLVPPVTLAPGAVAFFRGQYTPPGAGAQLCGPFTDIVTAQGTGRDTGRVLTDSDDAVCPVCTSPCIEVIKDCLDTSVLAGTPIRYEFRVRNCGNVPLQNVVAVDDNATPGVPGDDITTQIGNLAIGETKGPFTGTFPTAGNCNVTTYRNTVVVRGQNICPPPNQQEVTASDDCVASVFCPPCIRVTKLVTCKDPGVSCENASGYAKTAQGVRGENDPTCTQPNSGCPAFCYKVTVTNCNQVDLRDVTLRDDNGTPGNLADDISTPIGSLPVGQSRTVFYSSTHCTDAHNIVVAEGQSVFDSTANGHVRAEDSADVVVHPIMIMCVITLDAGTFDMDGKTADDAALTCKNGGVIGDAADDNHLSLMDGFSGAVCFNLYLTNPKNVDLDVMITLPAAAQTIPQLVTCIGTTPVLVPANSSRVISCALDFDHCPAELNGNVTVKGTARVTGDIRCIANACGHAATTAASTCPMVTLCETPPTVECRTTGGGNLLPGYSDNSCIPVVTTIFPSAGVDHISHGGQLGAPFSQMDCGAVLGNPCIRGQWEHVRHYQGNGNPRDVVDMNFHSVTPKGVFDSLSCACLGCCDPETGAFIPPTIGPLVKKFAICNPDDRKNGCGPMPRPAPANAIIFSGIGRITPTDDISCP